MMSGIEVAGLALAALPLIISALEHYADGASRVKTWWRYKSELEILRRVLDTEFEIYRNICALLLSNIAGPGKIEALLDDPGGPAWSDPDLEMEMKRLLQTSFPGYIQTINQMNAAIGEFKERLKLGPDGEAKWIGDGSFAQAYKVFKFSIRKSTYDDLTIRIKDSNSTLQQLTDTSLRLEQSRTRRRTKAPDFNVLRNYASGVYSIISRSLRCPCSGSHKVGLRLDPPTDESAWKAATNEEALISNLKFHLLLLYAQDCSSLTSAPWSIEQAEIHAFDPIRLPKCVSEDTKKKRKPKKSVNFSQTQTPLSIGSTISKMTTQTKIDNLCAAMVKLQNSMTTAECLGILVDEITKRQHALYPVPVAVNEKQSWSTTTLETILSDGAQPQKPFRNSERRRLALTFASNVLQLYETPWLEKDFRKKEIAFLKQSGHASYNHPFLSKSISSKQETQNSPVVSPNPLIRNLTLFNLGFLLIELCLGRPVDKAEIIGIERLIFEVRDRYGGRYETAVRRCIYCDFGCQTTDLGDAKFCTAVYDGVVAVLAEDLKEFTYGLS